MKVGIFAKTFAGKTPLVSAAAVRFEARTSNALWQRAWLTYTSGEPGESLAAFEAGLARPRSGFLHRQLRFHLHHPRDPNVSDCPAHAEAETRRIAAASRELGLRLPSS